MTKKVKAKSEGDLMRDRVLSMARTQARWLQRHVSDDRKGAQDLGRPDHQALAATLSQIPLQDWEDAVAAGARAVEVCLARNEKHPERVSSLSGRLPTPSVSGLLAREHHSMAAARHTFRVVVRAFQIFGKAINPNHPPI